MKLPRLHKEEYTYNFKEAKTRGREKEICVYIVHDTKEDFIFMVMTVRYVFVSSPALHLRHFTQGIRMRMKETMNEIYRIFMGIFAPKMASGMNEKVEKVMILTIQLAPSDFLNVETAHRCTFFSIRGLAIK